MAGEEKERASKGWALANQNHARLAWPGSPFPGSSVGQRGCRGESVPGQGPGGVGSMADGVGSPQRLPYPPALLLLPSPTRPFCPASVA